MRDVGRLLAMIDGRIKPAPLPLSEVRRRLHEYELIANKKSSLPSMKRQQIVRWVENNYKGEASE